MQLKVLIQPAIDLVAGLKEAVEQATNLLDEEVGPSAPLISAAWDTSRDDRGRLRVDLSLRDWTGKVSARFAPDELSNTALVKERLHRLWGELLQASSQEHYRKLVKILQEERGG